MRLEVLLPSKVLLDDAVVKVVARAENGSFCLLPRHVDFVTALPPGILRFVSASGDERFLGIDEATLVKCGGRVSVATAAAVEAPGLDELASAVARAFLELDERARLTRTAMARLEASVVRRFMELGR